MPWCAVWLVTCLSAIAVDLNRRSGILCAMCVILPALCWFTFRDIVLLPSQPIREAIAGKLDTDIPWADSAHFGGCFWRRRIQSDFTDPVTAGAVCLPLREPAIFCRLSRIRGVFTVTRHGWCFLTKQWFRMVCVAVLAVHSGELSVESPIAGPNHLPVAIYVPPRDR